MSILTYISAFLLSFAFSLALVPICQRLAKHYQIVDKPGARKIHQQTIPLLGGLAIFFSFYLVLFIFSSSFLSGNLTWTHLLGFSIGGLLITIGGVLDDKYNLKPQWQIIFPLLAVVALLVGGISIDKLSSPFGRVISLEQLRYLGPVIILVWILGMTYTTKLLDGIDGLVSGVGAIASFVIFLFTTTTIYHQPDIALTALILFGSSLGFLVFNFHPAKIFLGESGSLFIGYVLGVLSIISGSKIAIALLIMGIPILDVAWTIVRRLLAGRNPFRSADRRHLHHRLLDLGLSQRQVVLVFYTLALLFGASGLFLQSRGKFLALLFLLVLMFALILFFHYLDLKKEKTKPSLLLHICCAPCGSYISQELLKPKFRLTWYFYNSNLVNQAEYNARLKYVKKMAQKYAIPLIIEPYQAEKFLQFSLGLENEPERGKRCRLCYQDRLAHTASLAKQKGFDYYSSTLLYSPYKDNQAIKVIANELDKDNKTPKFYAKDFRDSDAFARSQALAKDLGLYRQKFCGCLYSLPPKQKENYDSKAK